MARRRLAWLVAIPLMLAGTETAHWLAFRLVYPNQWERGQALAASGHGYLSYWPAAAGIGGAIALAALVLAARGHAPADRDRLSRPPLLLFGALPPVAFALQEHLETLVHSGSIAGVAESPTFIVGLALQLPFALCALVAAWLLLRVAELVGARLRAATPRPAASPPLRTARPRSVTVRSLAPLGATPGRGPPSRI